MITCGATARVDARRWKPEVRPGLGWLLAQEHPHFRLLQQYEASDWAGIMPRSGYVLYTNALWHEVKRRFGVTHAETTHYHFNQLLHPYQRDRPEYHRTRLLQHYARRGQRDSGLYLSFVNFSYAGLEGDVFGNLLAILCGLAGEAMSHGIIETIRASAAADPYPIRVVLDPPSGSTAARSIRAAWPAKAGMPPCSCSRNARCKALARAGDAADGPRPEPRSYLGGSSATSVVIATLRSACGAS